MQKVTLLFSLMLFTLLLGVNPSAQAQTTVTLPAACNDCGTGGGGGGGTDSDGDGVPDADDLCPGTPAGTPVDATGCPVVTDSDGDGVPDADDLCPGTPAGAIVDADGCQYAFGYVACNGVLADVVDVTNPTTGRTWMDRNLGASQVATSKTDAAAYGDLFQWGRFADGHQCRTSPETTTKASTTVPNAGNSWDGLFIETASFPDNWLVTPDDNLWQGVNGVNNPCPAGYRIPTEAELNEERLSWSSNDGDGAFASANKFPQGGNRNTFGPLTAVGTGASYWSSTVIGNNARYLNWVNFGTAQVLTYARARGVSVRCIKN